MSALVAPELSANVARKAVWPLLLYAMTGFSGLLAEQSLEKYISLLVGATATASAVVIFTYFLGFAIGGIVVGRLLKTGRLKRALRAYALVELCVGIACVAFTFAFHRIVETLAPLQSLSANEFGKNAWRFGCGCLLVLPIASLMGASFPLIAQVLDDSDAAGPKRWNQAYSANLSGAVLAALIAPYFLLPVIGPRGAMWLCLGVCVFVSAYAQLRLTDASRPVEYADYFPAGTARLAHDTSLLLLVSFLSGAIFFALEILWTHLVASITGASVYAFSSMLAMVLAGLLIGSKMVTRRAIRSEPIRISILLQLCAFALVLQLRLWDYVAVLFVLAPPFVSNHFATRELWRLLVTALLIVPPASALGMIYPRLLSSPAVKREGNAWLAGYLSAANSAGCLLGALAATFLLIPAFGSETSLKLIVGSLGALWMFYAIREPRQSQRSRLMTVMATALLLFALVRIHWDWSVLTCGAGMYFGEVTSPSPGAAAPAVPVGPIIDRSIVYRDEHVQGGFTTVVEQRSPGNPSIPVNHYMYADGKFEGDDDPGGEYAAQFGFAAIPCLYNARFNRSLLIGLGTGHSARILKEAGFAETDIAEFSPGIISAAEAEFSHINHRVWRDPGVHLYVEDGRNLLLTNPNRRYDLITVELTTIWFSGATNLYSKEFYELARARLEPDGVLQQWVQLHRIGPNEIASAIATLRSVFPYVSYHAYAGAGMMLAADHPFVVTPERTAYLEARFEAGEQLSPEGAHKLVQELSHGELLSPAGVDSLIAATRPVINTDHNRYIEYATPKYASSDRDWRTYNLHYLASWNR